MTMDTSNGAGGPPKRTDVGYKRPPREHQFKKDGKPPPRKTKDPLREIPMSETLRKVLDEPRRVVVAGKVRWLTTADLVLMRAWQEAEKGSPSLRREMMRLSLSAEAPALEQAPLVVTDPSAPANATGFRLVPIDDAET
jgi:hypothetical protein